MTIYSSEEELLFFAVQAVLTQDNINILTRVPITVLEIDDLDTLPVITLYHLRKLKVGPYYASSPHTDRQKDRDHDISCQKLLPRNHVIRHLQHPFFYN